MGGRDEGDGRTIIQRRLSLTPAPSSGFVIEVREGPDRGLGLTIATDLPAPLLIGTSPVCDLRLGDPAISRRHASLEWAGNRLRLRDLGSSNGTFVGRLAVADVLLEGDEVVRLGEGTSFQLTRDVDSLPRPLSQRSAFGRLLGVSREMRRLYPLCEKLAASNVPVILEGETGTGKEVLAEALHEEGPRKAGPFVVFDCTSVHASLFESELFGHEKGAFTGAVSQRIGVFEEAQGGTLLIDELGDLPLELQAKLLRALERSEVRRVGGNKWIKVDVRVLAATRRNLDHEVQQGRFRDDLFHRLAVARIELPPLRKRKGDVGLLVKHLCKLMNREVSAIPPDVLVAWEDAEWPGNVREMRNAVARRLALGDLGQKPVSERELGEDTLRDTVEPPSLPPSGVPVVADDLVARILGENLPLVQAREKLVREFEAKYVAHVLAQHKGNVTHAAAASGIARRHFQRVKKRAGD